MTSRLITFALTAALAGCATSTPPIQIVRPLASTPIRCDDEPPAPKRPDGGYKGPGKVTVQPDAGPEIVIDDGWGISTLDQSLMSVYVVTLRTAYRTCREAVDAVNGMGGR